MLLALMNALTLGWKATPKHLLLFYFTNDMGSFFCPENAHIKFVCRYVIFVCISTIPGYGYHCRQLWCLLFPS